MSPDGSTASAASPEPVATATAEGGGPLAGVRVIGLEQSVAGPLCTRILSDLGADVVKWERADVGDFARHWDDHAGGESAQFWWLNRGKRSVAVNLRDEEHRELFFAHVAEADVLVHNMSPSAASRLGLDGDTLHDRFPHLVSCQISGYGASSSFRDRKAYDMLVQAESGIMSLTGTPEVPSRVGVSMCDVSTGIYAATLVVAAVHQQRRTGQGCALDVAMLDVAVEFLGPMLTSAVNAGVRYERLPQHHHAIAPYGVFACRDGQVVIAIEQDAEWQRFCELVLDAPETATRPEYATNLARVARPRRGQRARGVRAGRAAPDRGARGPRTRRVRLRRAAGRRRRRRPPRARRPRCPHVVTGTVRR